MKVLVTGATGFLGGRLVEHLLQQHYEVKVLVRKSSRVGDLPSEVEVAYGDVTQLATVLAACQGCEAAIHAAALVQAWAPDMREFERVNVGGLRHMIEALRQTESLQRLVYTSSFFALGPTDGAVASEEKVHSGDHFCTEYERTKWVADGVARRAAEEGLPLVTVYPGFVYGPGRRTNGNLVVQLVTDHLKGAFPGYIGPGTTITSFSYVDDVCLGIIAALEKGVPGRAYLLVGENASMVDLFKTVESLTGKPPPRRHLPFWLVQCLGFLSVVAAHITGQVPVITHQSVTAFKRDWAYASPKTEAELGIQHRSLREGLEATLKWLKDTKAI